MTNVDSSTNVRNLVTAPMLREYLRSSIKHNIYIVSVLDLGGGRGETENPN